MTTWSNQRAARRVALGYLVAVILVFVLVAVQLATHDGPDGSFAPVIAVAVTLPTSLVTILLPQVAEPWDGVVASAVLVGAALFQAWLLWLLLRGRRAR